MQYKVKGFSNKDIFTYILQEG